MALGALQLRAGSLAMQVHAGAENVVSILGRRRVHCSVICVLVHDWDLMAGGKLSGLKGCGCTSGVGCHGLGGEDEEEWGEWAAGRLRIGLGKWQCASH